MWKIFLKFPLTVSFNILRIGWDDFTTIALPETFREHSRKFTIQRNIIKICSNSTSYVVCIFTDYSTAGVLKLFFRSTYTFT